MENLSNEFENKIYDQNICFKFFPWFRPTTVQLFSKGVIGILNSLKKPKEKIRLYYYDTSGRFVLAEIEDTKKAFQN